MRKNSIRFYDLPEIYDIRLVHGVNVIHRFPRHIHHTVSFGIIERGNRVIDIRGNTVTIRAGECFVINPGEPHSCVESPEQSHDYWVISVNPPILEKIYADMTGQAETCPYLPHPIQANASFTRTPEQILPANTHSLDRQALYGANSPG